jgi:hypothetical protein
VFEDRDEPEQPFFGQELPLPADFNVPVNARWTGS